MEPIRVTKYDIEILVNNLTPYSQEKECPQILFPFDLAISPPHISQKFFRIEVIAYCDITTAKSKQLYQVITRSRYKFPNVDDREYVINLIHQNIASSITDFNSELAKINSALLVDKEHAPKKIQCRIPILSECRGKIV